MLRIRVAWCRVSVGGVDARELKVFAVFRGISDRRFVVGRGEEVWGVMGRRLRRAVEMGELYVRSVVEESIVGK